MIKKNYDRGAKSKSTPKITKAVLGERVIAEVGFVGLFRNLLGCRKIFCKLSQTKGRGVPRQSEALSFPWLLVVMVCAVTAFLLQ